MRVKDPLEDQAVIEEILQGSKEAFSIIVDKYKYKIYSVLRNMGASHQDAQDLTQETFIKSYRKLASHSRDRSFTAWMYAIAINLLKDHVRSRPLLSGQDQIDELQDDNTPEHYYLRKEWKVEVQRMLVHLPENYRIVLILRYTNELSYEEIGDITGMPSNQVRNCLYRAKQSLKKRLKSGEGMYNAMLESD
jgi:RNA polymerase sigma factor (sigma-70 family)